MSQIITNLVTWNNTTFCLSQLKRSEVKNQVVGGFGSLWKLWEIILWHSLSFWWLPEILVSLGLWKQMFSTLTLHLQVSLLSVSPLCQCPYLPLFSYQSLNLVTVVVVESISHVGLFQISRTAACQAPLSSTISWSLLKLMSIESMMLSNHLIFCRPLLLLPSIFRSISVFSNESALCIRWPKYWSFRFSNSPSNEHSGLISFRIDLFHLLAVKGLSRVFSSTTDRNHQFFTAKPSLWSNSHIHTWLLEKP